MPYLIGAVAGALVAVVVMLRLYGVPITVKVGGDLNGTLDSKELGYIAADLHTVAVVAEEWLTHYRKRKAKAAVPQP